MRITSFEYRAADGWTLAKMPLNGFNLLVGVSGAGKTRIVQSIEQVCSLALGGRWSASETPEWAYGAKFCIEIEHEEQRYRWEAELDQRRDRSADRAGGEGGSTERREQPWIVSERIWQGDSPLVERGPERFLLNRIAAPRFSRSQSAIAALNEDPRLSPLYAAFSHCIFRNLDVFPSHGIFIGDVDLEKYPTLEHLASDLDLPLHHRAYYMKELFPEAFHEIENAFREAFPHTQQMAVFRFKPPGYEQESAYNAAIAIREEGVDHWIFYSDLSSGMQRYLAFLFHLSFAPKGTVVLVDELESSLGINCLPAATRFLLSRAPDLQLILTSHHPYIIEQIPPSNWQIVTRRGSLVRVLPAANIPALADARTHLDRFTRLINLPEYLQ
jgi:hypothetical protein